MNIRHFQKINTNAELKSKICGIICEAEIIWL